tara:strand:- start:5968 stop:6192 length:225 start_codon:yes stop_codon:yes gene_type:complete
VKYLALVVFLCSTVFSVNYQIGQTISVSDQNITADVCNGENPHNGSNQFKLADLNGDLNGGKYYVIHIDLAAAW